MQLDWEMHEPLVQKHFLLIINQSTACVFTVFSGLRINMVVLVLKLIWYYSTSWVSNIGDLVSVLIFWFRILSAGDSVCWELLQEICYHSGLRRTQFFLQFLEN